MKKISIDQIEGAIIEASGNIAQVARTFGMSRGAIHYRIDNSPKLQKVLADSRETMLDNAESVLYKKVLEGSTPELIFFLKTQGKARGYVERSEIDHRLTDVTKLSDDELDDILKT